MKKKVSKFVISNNKILKKSGLFFKNTLNKTLKDHFILVNYVFQHTERPKDAKGKVSKKSGPRGALDFKYCIISF